MTAGPLGAAPVIVEGPHGQAVAALVNAGASVDAEADMILMSGDVDHSSASGG